MVDKIEGFDELKLKYLNGNRRVKGEILRSFETLYGYNRKSAIRLLRRGLRNRLQGRVLKKRGAKGRYQDPEFKQTLRRLWSDMEWQCGRNMKSALPRWLPDFEDEYGELSVDIRTRLLAVSHSTIDRILKEFRAKERWRGGTRASPLKDQIQISTSVLRDDRPGHIEVDTVAHCGGDMSGRFLWSFTATDIITGWTEVRAVWAKGMAPIIEEFSEMRKSFPFPVLTFDSDNGGEFINRAMFLFLQREGIPQYRSRSYEKNDNAHVEQKNRTHVRNYLGEMRIDNPEVCEAMNQILKDKLSILRNFFFPTRKLISKAIIRGRVYKVYDQPATPYERVIRSPHVPDSVKEQLREMEGSLKPIKLRKQLRAQLRQVLKFASVTLNSEASDLGSFGNT
jgi:hypothetical protein